MECALISAKNKDIDMVIQFGLPIFNRYI